VTVTPRGLLAVVVAVVVAAVCTRLGIWQLDRLDQRRARNAAIVSATALPPIELRGDSLAAVMRHPDAYHYRRAVVEGSYDAAHDFLLRGRAMAGRPGVHVVTPLRIAGTDTAVLVLRGWLPSPDAATADPRPSAEPGAREVRGIIQTLQTEGGAIPMQETVNGDTVSTFQRIDPRALRPTIPYPLLPVYLQILPSPPSSAAAPLARVPLPPLDEGPHLGYAIQWFGFAAVAILGILVVAVKQHLDER
jgi:surfeit locus 1 family protein